MKKLICTILILGFVGLILYSGYQLWLIQANYKEEADLHSAVLEYRPQEKDDEPINQSVIDLQAKYPDAIGWLTIPNTNIDYPFVQGKDNDYYLRRDINGSYALAGTLFLDYRCEKNFTSQNTIIYGHHMKNGSMFGTLKGFSDKAFFDKNRHGTICLPHDTLTLEFFAFLVIDPILKTEIYSPSPDSSFIEFIQQNARHYRDIGLTEADRIVTLSTCAYEFDNARYVVLGVLRADHQP